MIVQVKENQPKLLKECQLMAERAAQSLRVIPTHASRSQGHGRRETRVVKIIGTAKSVSKNIRKDWNALIADVIQVKRKRCWFDTKEKSWTKSVEISYYVSTKQLPLKTYAQEIRGHWGIENQNHYVRDVSLGEDQSRIRVHPEIMGILRSFALNVMRANRVKNIKEALYVNALNVKKLLDYKGLL